MSKQLLILPDTKRFNKPQTKEVNEAGFVVVYLPDPSQARLITPEIPPVSTHAMLLAALKAIRVADSTYSYRKLIDELIAAAVEAKEPPADAGTPGRGLQQ